MTFHISAFLDSTLGQRVGTLLVLIVILVIRDNSLASTGRMLLNQFVYAGVSAMITNKARRKENHLPALYQQLFLLFNKFLGDITKFRLALNLIIAHQRLRNAPITVNADLSAFHRQWRSTVNQIISASSDDKLRQHFQQLLDELNIYQEKLHIWEAPTSVIGSVQRLTAMLHKYQYALASH